MAIQIVFSFCGLLCQAGTHTNKKTCYFVHGIEYCAQMDMFNELDSDDKLIGCLLHSFPLEKIEFKVFSLNRRVSRLLQSDNNFFIEQNNCIFTAYTGYRALLLILLFAFIFRSHHFCNAMLL